MIAASTRLAFIVLSLITTLAFLQLIPNKITFYTRPGTKSLLIFLWHGVFIKLLVVLKVFVSIKDNFSENTTFLIATAIITTSLITYICATNIVNQLTNRFLFNPGKKIIDLIFYNIQKIPK